MKLDEAQLKEQEALRKQLQQEQDLLVTFQESQDQKLLTQHDREKRDLDEKVTASKLELEKQVRKEGGREGERERKEGEGETGKGGR